MYILNVIETIGDGENYPAIYDSIYSHEACVESFLYNLECEFMEQDFTADEIQEELQEYQEELQEHLKKVEKLRPNLPTDIVPRTTLPCTIGNRQFFFFQSQQEMEVLVASWNNQDETVIPLNTPDRFEPSTSKCVELIAGEPLSQEAKDYLEEYGFDPFDGSAPSDAHPRHLVGFTIQTIEF